jgi:hypothetical protein
MYRTLVAGPKRHMTCGSSGSWYSCAWRVACLGRRLGAMTRDMYAICTGTEVPAFWCPWGGPNSSNCSLLERRGCSGSSWSRGRRRDRAGWQIWPSSWRIDGSPERHWTDKQVRLIWGVLTVHTPQSYWVSERDSGTGNSSNCGSGWGTSSSLTEHCNEKHGDSEGFWRRCTTLRVTGFWTLSIAVIEVSSS